MNEVNIITELFNKFKSVEREEIENYMKQRWITLEFRDLKGNDVLEYSSDRSKLILSKGVRGDEAIYLLLYGLYYYYIGESTIKTPFRNLHDAGDSYAELVFNSHYKNIPKAFDKKKFDCVDWFKQLPSYVESETQRQIAEGRIILNTHQIIIDKVREDIEDGGETLSFFPVQYWAGYKKGTGAVVNTKGLTEGQQILMVIQVYKFFLDGVKQGNYNPFTDDDGDNDVREVIRQIQEFEPDNIFGESTEIFEKLLRKEK